MAGKVRGGGARARQSTVSAQGPRGVPVRPVRGNSITLPRFRMTTYSQELLMDRARTGGAPLCLSVAIAASALLLSACERRESGAAGTGAESATAAPPAATTATPPAPDRPVDAERLAYAEVEEQLVYGYFAAPSDMVEPLPALLLVHDWWGLDDETRAAANRLAAAGYMVLAVDLYGGETVADIAAARLKNIDIVENVRAVQSNLQQAVQFVGAVGAPSVGMVGWGAGGGIALNTAVDNPERISAVVLYYSQVPTSSDDLATLEARVLGMFGSDDRTISADSIDAFAAAMNRLSNPADIEIYAGAGHGFADSQRRQYNPAAAARAWQRMLDFLAANLVEAGQP
jgi:carboxymethylenebutenolidase